MSATVHPLDLALAASIEGQADLSESILRGIPDDPRARFNLGWHEMRHGRLNAGLALLESGRGNVYGLPPLRDVPLLEGSPKGKTILLRGEGGLGDEIVHARFARDFAERGARVVLSCARGLASVLARVAGVSAVVAREGEPHVFCDVHVPLMGAPLALGLEYDTLSGAPYLQARRDFVEERWRAIIGPRDGRLKIGIRWRGQSTFEHEQHRTFPPEHLFALAELDGVEVFSLQRDEGVELMPVRSKIVDLGPRLRTWEDTAAAIECLDLVISSCTSVAHLAAGLGKPTWVIVPVLPYYVWSHPWKGETSPWYDTVRLFRQEVYGAWEAPLSRLREEVIVLRGRKT